MKIPSELKSAKLSMEEGEIERHHSGAVTITASGRTLLFTDIKAAESLHDSLGKLLKKLRDVCTMVRE